MSNYVGFNKSAIEELLVAEMGFTQIPSSREYVYTRPVTTKSGVKFPYAIQVYSSVLCSTRYTDSSGADAIQVTLIDTVTGKPAAAKQKRVHRTKNAFPNLRERCRDLFRLVIEAPKCPCCGAMMNVRTNTKTGKEFLSCSRYAPGKHYHCTGKPETQRIAA
jgi:hypothetical protein